MNDVDATSSPAAVQAAFETWARDGSRTGPGKPFFVYFVDHGLDEKFCVSGCGAGQAVSPLEVNSWLDALEAARGVDQASVIVEACRSGSFINREAGNPLGGLGKAGRVIITSTDAQNNAYASAEGAFFSDAFFSCAVNNQDLKTCFDQGVDAVQATGVSQRPQLDDNGDGLFNSGDGALARTRYLTNLFSSTAPTIDSARASAQRRRRHPGGDRERRRGGDRPGVGQHLPAGVSGADERHAEPERAARTARSGRRPAGAVSLQLSWRCTEPGHIPRG